MQEKLELLRGSGNSYRDLGCGNAVDAQFQAILAAAIFKTLHRERLTARTAHDRTGFAAQGAAALPAGWGATTGLVGAQTRLTDLPPCYVSRRGTDR